MILSLFLMAFRIFNNLDKISFDLKQHYKNDRIPELGKLAVLK